MSDDQNTGRNEKGHFLPGNKFWEARASCGPNFKFENPDDLWKACCEYFAWNEANPLWEDKICSYEGVHEHKPLARMRAMTIIGLCMFIGITQKTWCEWRLERPDLSDVITAADNIIKQQKFEGAAAGMLQHNIIARDLGLVDKMASQMQYLDKEGKPTDPDNGVKSMLATVLAKVQSQNDE